MTQAPTAGTTEALAGLLGVTPARLRWAARSLRVDSTRYDHFRIPKATGGVRQIAAPRWALKLVQRRVVDRLLSAVPVSVSAHGFVRGGSIASNAQLHAGAALVLAMDLADFFPTVSWRRARNTFRREGYTACLATILGRVGADAERAKTPAGFAAVSDARLVQGAPTSPAVTNIVCRPMDRALQRLARAFGAVYSRYADDLTFSWARCPTKRSTKQFQRDVRRIVARCGFRVNPAKTKVMHRGVRQSVTGLVVNAADGSPPARVPREVRRRLRAALHRFENGMPTEQTREQLQGFAAYVYQTNPREGADMLARLERK